MARRDTHHYDYKFITFTSVYQMLMLGLVLGLDFVISLLHFICCFVFAMPSLECWCGVTSQWFVSPFFIKVHMTRNFLLAYLKELSK